MIDKDGRETKTVVEAHLYEENDKLREVIKAAQEMLAKYMPSGGITGEEAISGLLGILDNQDLFKLLNDTEAKGPYGLPPLSRLNKIFEDSLNIELEKLELKDGDIIIVRKLDGLSRADRSWLADKIRSSATSQRKDNIQIIFIDGDVDIKSVDEKDMNEAGWYRLPSDTDMLDRLLKQASSK